MTFSHSARAQQFGKLPPPIEKMQFAENYTPDPNRYQGPAATYRRCGRSGLDLPAISLGLWHNFGHDHSLDVQRSILTRAFDLGITHFDLANNYGIPYGSAEENFGRHLQRDFRPYRDQLIITSKAGYDMWPGPYGKGGGGRKYLLASLDQSLSRMGLDYVDIFYSHLPDPTTPIEETILALDQAVRSGRALYVGISSYSTRQTEIAMAVARDLSLPLVIHQPVYSLLKRGIEEDGLLEACQREGLGMAVFSPLAQGLLTKKYLGETRIPAGSRAVEQRNLNPEVLTDSRISQLRILADIAELRGQSLSQMSLAWLLNHPQVTTVLVGASSPQQLEENCGALQNLDFTAEELESIDRHSQAAAL